MWTVYIVRCRDKTLYTGIARDLEKRLCAHRAKRGAKYTRSRLPLRLVYHQKLRTQSAALKREHEIKKLSREAKQALIKEWKKRLLSKAQGRTPV